MFLPCPAQGEVSVFLPQGLMSGEGPQREPAELAGAPHNLLTEPGVSVSPARRCRAGPKCLCLQPVWKRLDPGSRNGSALSASSGPRCVRQTLVNHRAAFVPRVTYVSHQSSAQNDRSPHRQVSKNFTEQGCKNGVEFQLQLIFKEIFFVQGGFWYF